MNWREHNFDVIGAIKLLQDQVAALRAEIEQLKNMVYATANAINPPGAK